MSLPLGVNEKMKVNLGFDGTPHRILIGHWIDTNCLEWKFPPFNLELPQPSPALREAFNNISTQIKGENFETPKGHLDLKKYHARTMEVFEQIKTPALQVELDIYEPKIMAFNKQHAQWLKTPAIRLKEIRTLLKDEPVIAYWSDLEWEGNIPETLVVAPVTDQFEILQIEQTDGANYGLSTKDIILELEALDKKYEINITGASSSGLDFTLGNIPKDKDAKELGESLLKFCPDLYEAPRRFPKGKVSLWWD